MAMVISSTTKAAIGGFLALMVLGAVLVVGAAFGWFDPKREDEDTPAKVSARLQGRTSFVTHRGVNLEENRSPVMAHSLPHLNVQSQKGQLDTDGKVLSDSEFSSSLINVNWSKDNVTLSSRCTCTPRDLAQVLSKVPSLRGPPGPQGPTGADGTTGAPGKSGQIGNPGPAGSPGTKGDRGDTGEQGVPGIEGPPGPKGEPGADGAPGLQGPPGLPGNMGIQPAGYLEEGLYGSGQSIVSPPAVRGPMGLPGPQGERGYQGNKGERGLHGSKGEKGERGYMGLRGPHGAKGERGAPGRDGLPGLPGAHGRPAEKGEKGSPGPPGPPGPPATPSNQLDVSSNAVTNANTNIAAELTGTRGPIAHREIKGESGDKGEKGEKGLRGMEGPQGFPGSDGKPGERGDIGPSGLPGSQGPMGPAGTKGDKGDAGPPGPLAISKDDAIVLTKGEKGDPGLRGKRGHPGPPGPRGPPGIPGPPGVPGSNGVSGDIGLPGWTGPPGATGTTGPPGQKGEKGDPGIDPLTLEKIRGEKGERGTDGIPGTPGKEGPRGPPGPPGTPATKIEYITAPGPPGPPGPPGAPGHIIGRDGPINSLTDTPDLNLGPPGKHRDALQTLRSLNNFLRYRQEHQEPVVGKMDLDEDEDGKAIIGTIIFKTTQSLLRVGAEFPLGTLAYIIQEQALLVRVNNGWQYVAMGSLLAINSPLSNTPTRSPLQNILETSSLIHQKNPAGQGPMLRLAALDEPHTGDMHGVSSANYECRRQASRANVIGSFRAFISSRVQNIDSVVDWADRDIPVVNTRGDILFNSWAEMFDGSGALFAHAPRIFSFSGKNVLLDASWAVIKGPLLTGVIITRPTKAIWHGSLTNGEPAMDAYCDAWHTANPDKYGLGSSLRSNKLLDQQTYSCSSRLIVLCIEVTPAGTVRRKKRSSDMDDEKPQLNIKEKYKNETKIT